MTSQASGTPENSPGSAGAPPQAASSPPPIAAGPHTLLVGRRLGQYQIAEKIGQGGMGCVFRATDTALDRAVAIKVLFSSPLTDDPKHAERFTREARSLARLTHPNLLHVYNVGSENDCYYFAMELLQGETLGAAIYRRKRIPADELVFWLGQILSALHYVHQQGITHRDIKSGNIMLCGRRAVLMDFGLAKDEHYTGLTSIGVVLGTPDYMSPEAAEGAPAGPPTDLYSFGVVFYEALTGVLPFQGKSAMSIIRQHLDTAPPPLESHLPNIDPLLATIIHKCLAKKPAERYPNCPALARELLRLYTTAELAALADESGTGVSAVARPTGASQARAVSAPPPAPVPPGISEATVVSPLPAPAAAGAANPSGPTIVLSQQPGTPSLSPPYKGGENTDPENALTVVSAPEATIVLPESAPPARSWTTWLWAGAGFFGVLLLVIILGKGRNSENQKNVNPAAWNGQPLLLQTPNGVKKVKWIEFKAEDPDPAKWYHLIAERQPDGAWKQVRVPHSEIAKNHGGQSINFLDQRELQDKP